MAVRKPLPPSIRRLERKVDQLAADVKEDREATTELGHRLNKLNLNGSAAALHKLAENSDRLLKLAEVSDYITVAVEERKEKEIVRAWFKRNLNPITSRVGALFWAVAVGVIALVIANHIQ